MAVEPKIIYLEADEEITSVVDKLRKTEFSKVVLVVPKEAGLLQSVINLKLLKRQAENLQKTISIVTGDKVGRNLAENVGIVASAKLDDRVKQMEKVAVPEEPLTESEESPLAETKEIVFKKEKEDNKGNWHKSGSQADEDEILVKETDESAEAEEDLKEDWNKKTISDPVERNLMPKFPLKKVALVSSLILLVLFTVGFIYLPRAKATIMVQAEKKLVTLDFKADKNTKLDAQKGLLPAQIIEATKQSSKKFPATGKKNVGTKATGNLRISNLSGSPINWITGTRFYPDGSSSNIFRATSAVNVPDGQIVTISVEADQPGDQYNGFGTNQKFLLASGPSTNITITSKDGMSGGTSKEVSYVTQGDINSAKDSVSKDAFDDATTDFNKKIENLKVIDDSRKDAVTSFSANPDLNTEATDFTMTVNVSKKALAYSLEDIGELVKTEVNSELGYSKQIIDDGAKNADVVIAESNLATGTFSGTIKTSAYVSGKFDNEQIKDELIGLNQPKAEKYLNELEGVDSIKLEFWPSFIKLFPRIKNHIFITVQVADTNGSN